MSEQEELKINPETGLVEENTVDQASIPTASSIDEDQREELKEEVTQDAISKNAEMELSRGYRVVDVPPFGVLHLHKPTIEDDYNADTAYATEVSRLMDDEPNLPTTEEMEIRLAKRGIWTDVDTADLEEMRQDLVSTSTELLIAKAEYKDKTTVKAKNKITKLTKEYDKIRKAFLKKETAKQKYMSMTIEGRADEKRLVVKMSRCVKKPDGTRMWDTAEELKKEKDSEPVGRIVFEFITFAQGVDPRVLEQIPDLLEQVGDIEV